MVYVNICLTLHGNYVYLTIAICRQKMVGFIVMVCSLILFLPSLSLVFFLLVEVNTLLYIE